jgi:WD40 repeat protein
MKIYPNPTPDADSIVECLFTLQISERTVTCLKFSPCGRFFAFSSADGLVEIYTINGTPRYRLTGFHLHGINTIAWSPCSGYVLLGSDDGFLSVWNIQQQLPLITLRRHIHNVLTVAWSPCGTLLASGGVDGTVCLFDVASGALLRQLEAHNDIIRSVTFSSDSSLIISSSNDGTLRYWDIATGFCLRTLTQPSLTIGHGQLVVSPYTDLIAAVGCLDGCIRVYDTVLSTCVMMLVGHSNTQYSLPLSFYATPSPLNIETFYYDLNNLENIEMVNQGDDINATHKTMLRGTNDLNYFLSNELPQLSFQEIGYDPTMTTSSDEDYTTDDDDSDCSDRSDRSDDNTTDTSLQQSKIQKYFPKLPLPSTHPLINRHNIRTKSNSIIISTNPLIATTNLRKYPTRITTRPFQTRQDPTSTHLKLPIVLNEQVGDREKGVFQFTRGNGLEHTDLKFSTWQSQDMEPGIPGDRLATIQTYREFQIDLVRNGDKLSLLPNPSTNSAQNSPFLRQNSPFLPQNSPNSPLNSPTSPQNSNQATQRGSFINGIINNRNHSVPYKPLSLHMIEQGIPLQEFPKLPNNLQDLAEDEKIFVNVQQGDQKRENFDKQNDVPHHASSIPNEQPIVPLHVPYDHIAKEYRDRLQHLLHSTSTIVMDIKIPIENPNEKQNTTSGLFPIVQTESQKIGPNKYFFRRNGFRKNDAKKIAAQKVIDANNDPTKHTNAEIEPPKDDVPTRTESVLVTKNRRPVTMLVSGSEDGGICMWNILSVEEQNIFNFEREKLGEEKKTIIMPGELLYKVRAHHDVVSALDCHPFLPLIISGGMDKDCSIKMWKFNK